MEILESLGKEKYTRSTERLETLQKYHSELQLQGNAVQLDLMRRIWKMVNILKETWMQLGGGGKKRLKGGVVINSKPNVHEPCKRVAKEGDRSWSSPGAPGAVSWALSS